MIISSLLFRINHFFDFLIYSLIKDMASNIKY